MNPASPISAAFSSRVPRVASGRRERHKADIRFRLFQAALELFGTRGFAATTVEDITQAADVAKGTFFNYFPTKEHLLTEFSELRLEIVRAARSEAKECRLPMREVLRRLTFALMKEPGRSRAMARCMLLGALGDEPVAGVVQKKLTESRRLIAEAIAIGQARGEIRRDWTAADIARWFQQSFFGAMNIWVLHPRLNLERSLESTFVMFWSAIAAPTAKIRTMRSAPQAGKK
jgi:AcrR family transcriptional regulator